MIYNVGTKFTSKKPHACGGRDWEIVRTGADVKIKCLKCSHFVFVSQDKLAKIIKKYIENGVIDDKGKK